MTATLAHDFSILQSESQGKFERRFSPEAGVAIVQIDPAFLP